MELVRIALTNLKRRRTYSVIIIILILVASVLLITSFSIYSKSNQLMDETATVLHTPDSIYYFAKNNYKDDYLSWFEKNSGVAVSKTAEALYFSDAVLKDSENGSYDTGYLLINPYNPAADINRIQLIGSKLTSLNQGEMILPYLYKQTKHLQIGDEVTLSVNGQNYPFVIKGFAEDLMLGSSMTIAKDVWISNMDYTNVFKPQASDTNQVVSLMVSYKNSGNEIKTDNAFQEQFQPQTIFSVTYHLAKSTTMSVIDIIIGILLFFSLFLILIAVMVIRYSVLVSIEADYTEIGIMKALGLSARQIYLLTLLPYMLLALTGTFISIGISALTVPAAGNLILFSSGLNWQGNLSGTQSLIIVILITAVITFYAYWIARKTRQISPIVAIRKGIAPHHYSKWPKVNLVRNKHISLLLALAIKQMFSKLRQYIMLLIITVILVFPVVFGGALANLFHDSTGAMTVLGLEPADISFTVNDNEDFSDVINQIKAAEGLNINHLLDIDETELSVDNQKIETFVSDDFNSLLTSNLVEGRNPINRNEIAFTPTMLGTLHKKVGDFVSVTSSDGSTLRFLIVGSYQSVENGGETARIHLSGMQNLDAGYQLHSVYMYLKSGASASSVTEDLNSHFGSEISFIVNQQSSMGNIFAPIGHSLNLVITILIIVSSFIILLVTFLIGNIVFHKEIRELGILKSLGFSKGQIQRQIVYRFLFIALAGILIGVLLTVFGAGSLFILLLKQFGMATLTLHYKLPLILLESFLILGAVFISAWVSTAKIKQINPYTLINE